VEVLDVSPVRSRTQIAIDRSHQSVSGKALCVAMSATGQRLYLGGHSGVWRSVDGGQVWTHPERPQPPPGETVVPGALLPPAVYDLLILPSDPDVVLAATGRDSRTPPTNGIYRSTDAGNTWQRVHAFRRPSGAVGTVGSLAVAPDDGRLVFAGGQFAVGVSTDGGRTWTERSPQSMDTEAVWYVVCGPAAGSVRRVYAVGRHVWQSVDAGQTWVEDPVDLSAGSPADGLGQCARCLCVDPEDSRTVYLAREAGELWRGRFPSAGTGSAQWTQLPAPPMNHAGTTASGTDFVVVHSAPDGQRYLIYSDRRTVHISVGDPTSSSDWTRIDPSPVHLDPHGIAVTPTFAWASAGAAGGRIAMVNDGGAVVSSDGAASWDFGTGLATLGLVNTAVLPRADKEPGLVIQMGDNNGFFSADGGRNWRTQDYRGGDNDCSFADPVQPHRLIVFAPRHEFEDGRRRAIFLYTVAAGQIPDGSRGTDDRRIVPGPRPPPGETKSLWTAVSGFYSLGYRPVVLTLEDEQARPDGDFVTIILSDDKTTARLLRTTAMSSVTDPDDWISTATAEGQGVKVFRQGPALPTPDVSVVQASGGHDQPTFYVGDQQEDGGQRIWRWRRPLTAWEPVVPGTAANAPVRARRFFVDPYRPSILYVLDTDHVRRTGDGGETWVVDEALERALTQDGAFPVGLTSEAGSAQALLRDMVFDPTDARWRVAIGPAGVFQTRDGQSWNHLLLSAAAGMRPNNAVCDFVSRRGARLLYLSTSNRGVLRLDVPPPLLTLGVLTLARRCLGLPPPLSLRRDIFGGAGGPTLSLKTRLREIHENC
jgi:hypothetical protein